MSRYPPIPQDAQNPEQQRVEAGPREILTRVPDHVQLTSPSGALLGPYASLLYTPDLITPWQTLATAIDTQPLLTAREKRTHHPRNALRAQRAIADAKAGRVPVGLSETEIAVYALALEMARSRGPIPDAVFGPAADALGREKVARVAHVVGGFGYVALLANLAAEGGVEVGKD
ncbi:hypothetical protein BJY00DRAFT_309144 [Aspergillus carlsbadensis]|nr:hypothetical protein BJY00DRAFT_309144 [Aspergillus carlsbadensis]